MECPLGPFFYSLPVSPGVKIRNRAGRGSEFEEMKIGGGKDQVVERVYKSV